MDELRIGSAIGTDQVDAAVLDRSGRRNLSYVDHFTLSPLTATMATPEQWARTMFGDAPSPAERFIWRGLLRLRLHQGRSPSTVAGWLIAERGQDWIRLEAESAAMTGNLVVRATDEALSLTTMIQHDRVLASLVWRPLSMVHRRLAPGLLREAADTMTASQRPPGPVHGEVTAGVGPPS